MPGLTELQGGLRNGGTDAAPVWHTLATLKDLRKTAQTELANTLSNNQKNLTETSAAFKLRVEA